jgi:hypothetical protein
MRCSYTDICLICVELKKHLPFAILSTCLAIVVIGFLSIIIGNPQLSLVGGELFHIFHPLHILASAAATTAMYWIHRRKFINAIVIGVLGAIVICSLSDIIFPFLCGSLLSVKMQFHLCVVQHPLILIPFLLVGVIAGFVSPEVLENSTIYSHSVHILLSTMASLVYLISFGFAEWIHFIGPVFVIVIFVVLIPCCLSDIVFPLIFVEEKKE